MYQNSEDLVSCKLGQDTWSKEIYQDVSDIPQPKVSRTTITHGWRRSLVYLLSVLLLVWLWAKYRTVPLWIGENESFSCPQSGPVTPSEHAGLFQQLEKLFETEKFRLAAYESLGGAVRIPTETHDDVKPPGEDPRWNIFDDLHDHLVSTFPLLHSHLKLTKVNTYALVYHWQGSDDALKPILLAAHQDVVPVDPQSASEWIQPPYSGYYDGKWIWGRGSCDDKSGLIASMMAVENLLKMGFKPSRTVVLAFGIDEERGGKLGATAIRDFLLQNYGEDAFSILVDEGGGIVERYGSTFAMPAVAEKGNFPVRMEVLAPGGHSSVPPLHTSVGILASLIAEVEANPHPHQLRREGTYYQALQCFAEHGHSMPSSLRRLIKRSRTHNKALHQLDRELVKLIREYAASTGTTQAVDVIHGGVKSNALPEQAYAIIDHRIADYSSVEELKSRFTSIVVPIAARYNVTVNAFGHFTDAPDDGTKSGHLILSSAFGTALNPAPVTPTTDSGPWKFLSGTILSALATSQQRNNTQISAHVAPGLSLGNTDTRHYWKLTKHIFRYGHRRAEDAYNGAHTVNEAIKAEGFLEMIRFFTMLILNADETELLE